MAAPEPLPWQLTGAPFTVREGHEAGLSRSRMRARDLASPFRGVRTTDGAGDLESLCRSYAAQHRGHYFSHGTAAALWGLPLPRKNDPEQPREEDPGLQLHVSVAGPARQPRVRGVIGHRGQPGAAVHDVRGLPVLAPCETWCQLGAVLGHDDLIAAGDGLVGWREPLTTLARLDEAILRFGNRGGTRALRAARAEIRPGSASPRETHLRLDVLRGGYPEPELNGPIPLSAGWTTHGDLVFRRYRVLLEYDGEQHRLLEHQFHRDVDRLNDLAHDGWLVIRVHKRATAAETLTRLDRALRQRGWRP